MHTLKLLYIEDDPSDIELFESIALPKLDKFEVSYCDDLDEIERLLEQGFNAVISDYNLLGFNGLDVLELVKGKAPDLPIIFFSSKVGDERAVKLIQQGATDFVLKENISKIPLAIERALKETALRIDKKRFETALVNQNRLLDTLFHSLTDIVFFLDKENKISKVNKAFCEFFDFTEENLIGKSCEEIFPESVNGVFCRENRSEDSEVDFISHNGSRKILHVVKCSRNDNDLILVMRDITERRLLEEQNYKDSKILNQSENHTHSGSFELDVESDIIYLSNNFKRLLNLDNNRNIISMSRLVNFVYPEDRQLFKEKFEKMIASNVDFEFEHRYMPTGKKGDRNYCKTVIKSYLGAKRNIFYGTIIDITESRMNSLALLDVQEQQKEIISKELHDNIGPKLSASSMHLNTKEKNLDKVKLLLDDAITDIRKLSHGLSTGILKNNSFSASVDYLVENSPFSEIISCRKKLDDSKIPLFIGGHLYRILQESLNNIMKYAKATSIQVNVEEKLNSLNLSIIDDGIGFQHNQIREGNGLRNIRERVRHCNGEVTIKSQPGEGTQINIKTPLPHV